MCAVNASSIRCIKWFLFVFNLLFFLTGCCMIGLGVWLNVAREDWKGISNFDYISVAYVAIAAGSIVVIIAFLGCCGAITENKTMLTVFFIFLLVIFLLEISAGVVAYVWRREVNEELKKQLEKRIPDRYYKESDVKTAVNSIQEFFHCCGLNNISDWSKKVDNYEPFVDQSCCITKKDNSYYNANCKSEQWIDIVNIPTLINRFNTKGCLQSIRDFLEENLLYIAVIGITFAAFQLVGMTCAMVLYCALRRAQKTG